MPRRISEERRKLIKQDLKDGLSQSMIARDRGISQGAVWEIDQERKADDKLLAAQIKKAKGAD